MNKPHDTTLVQETGNEVQHHVEYVPLDPQEVKDYAHKVCTALSNRDIAYSLPEVMYGFSSFLVFLNERLAKSLTQGQQSYPLTDCKKEQTGSGGHDDK